MSPATADIGLIGLAVMGENLVLNMESRGYTVAVFNRTQARVTDFVANVLGQKLTRLQYDAQSGVTAFTEKGLVVRLGDSQNLDYKLSVWKELTSSAGATEPRSTRVIQGGVAGMPLIGLVPGRHAGSW